MNLLKYLASYIFFVLFGAKGNFSILKKKTAIIKKNAIPKLLCNKLINKFETIISNEKNKYLWKDKYKSDVRLVGFEKYYPDLEKKLDIKRIIKSIDKYNGRKTKDWFLMLNRVVPKKVR